MRSRTRNGVTLIELMVVMSIMAIMLGAGLALFTESAGSRLRAARMVLGRAGMRTTARNTRAGPMRLDPEGGDRDVGAAPVASWH